MRPSKLARGVVALVVLVACSLGAFAQQRESPVLYGIVTDIRGDVIAGCTVEVIVDGRVVHREVTPFPQGRFTIQAPEGRWFRVRVTAGGFQGRTTKRMRLRSGDTDGIFIVLVVNQVKQSVGLVSGRVLVDGRRRPSETRRDAELAVAPEPAQTGAHPSSNAAAPAR